MTQPKRIYLAGPEVFFPAVEHRTIVAEKKRLLQESKPAFGFSLDGRHFHERAGATDLDALDNTIEDFEMSDNLMIKGGIHDSGGQLFVAEQPGEHRFFSAELFRRCVKALANA